MLNNIWMKSIGGVLLAGVLILGPAKLLSEVKTVRGMISELYDNLRSDEHLVASMRQQLETQHRQIAALGVQNKKAERQVRAEQARLASDENRLQALRCELELAQLHLRSANDNFPIGERTLTRSQLSSMADNWLSEAQAIEQRLPQSRESLAALTTRQQSLLRQMADAQQAWTERVRHLEDQTARLESAETQVAMGEMLRHAQAADLVFQSQYATDMDQLEERIDALHLQADYTIGPNSPSQELVFHRAPDAVADRIGQFLGTASTELSATSD